MALQSKFQLNDKLRACAAADKDHIGENTFPPEDRKGVHVGLIHEALNAWVAKQKPPVRPVAGGEVSARAFGGDTARLVKLFKAQKNILNFKGEIDPIVGIKTVSALDLELPALLKPSPNPEPTRPIADIVVKFQGAFEEGLLTPDSVLSGRRVAIYKPMPNQPFGNAVMLNPFNGRALVRVGRKTTTIGDASLGVFTAVSFDVLSKLRALQLDAGKVFIHGSSSGGRNAIDFSSRASGFGLKPHFVAAVDAAFFQADTPSRPEANIERPRTTPNFVLSAGATPDRHNFFQTMGNHAKRSIRQGVLFTSDMKGEEIHGTVTGFKNDDLTGFLPRGFLSTDDEAHGDCGKRGTGEVERLIADELLLGT